MRDPGHDTTARRSLLVLVSAVVLLGLADSITGSYFVLFAADAGLEPFEVGVVSSAIALAGIVTSMVLGRRFDQRPTRTFLAVICLLGAVGWALVPELPGFVPLLLLGLTLIGVLGAGFPQLFALGAVSFGARDRQRAAPVLRSGWSFAWALGPLVGAGVVTVSGYTGLFWVAATALLVTAAVVLTAPQPRRIPVSQDGEDLRELSRGSAPGAGRRTIAASTASMLVVHTAMFAGSIALPLYVTRELDRPPADVGVLFSACAGVEVVAALALVWLLPRLPLRVLIQVGIASFVVYFGLTVLADGLPLLLAAQAARGCAIAIVGTAGIQYFQALATRGVGAATALFSNAVTAGSLIAGVLAGSLVQGLGPTAALAACGGLSLLAGLTFSAGRTVR